MKNKIYGIHWFRRDLRIAGNENLKHNWKITERNVLGVFFFDEKFLAREDFSHNRFAFFINSLKELKHELQLQGGDLLVINEQANIAFPKIFEYLKQNRIKLPHLITYGNDYEPYAIGRDKEIKNLMEMNGIKTHSGRDHVLFEPREILKDDKSFYQIYTPYSKKWFGKLKTDEGKARVIAQKNNDKYYKNLLTKKTEKIFKLQWDVFKNFPYTDQLDYFSNKNSKHVTIEIPNAGFKAAYEKMNLFKNKLKNYEDERNFPAVAGTSQLSIYQKNGSLVSSQIIAGLGLEEQFSQYLKEIAWREFYYSILFHRPDVEKNTFLPQYQNLKWQNNPKWFLRWCAGETGFPIVDAGMRQLNTTGWMHNRVRMIVASFLTKDLLIDWRWGENYFMKMLLDGDLAPNNGGWQWAASTGCDPQPYFRIFNPWLQAAKFDPDAGYIKTYIPELKNISVKDIHNPEGERGIKYPKPIVDHSTQKHKVLALFTNARGMKTP